MAAFNLKDEQRNAWSFQGQENGINFQNIDPFYFTMSDAVIDSVGPATMIQGRIAGEKWQALGLNVVAPPSKYVLQIWTTENGVATLKAVLSSDSPNATANGRIKQSPMQVNPEATSFANMSNMRKTFLYWGDLFPFEQLKSGDIWVLYGWMGDGPPFPVAYPPNRAVLLN